MNKKKRFHHAWIVLIGMAIVMGLARGGLNMAGGLFLSPVSQDLNISMGSLSLYLSVASIATMIGMPFAGQLIAKYDTRMVLIIAILMQGGAFAAFSFMNSVWGWYILAVPMALGAIFTTTLVGPILINNWFKEKNGLALGLMMATVGLFGIFIQPFAGNLIGSQGWRSSYQFLGIGAIVLIIPIVLLFIRKEPKDMNLLPYGAADIDEADEESVEAPSDVGVSFADAKKSKAFIAMVLFLFFMTATASFAQHIAPYATALGYSVEFSGGAMGYYMGGMFVGALVFGFLTDKIGAKTTSFLSMGVGVVSVLTLIFFPENPLLFNLGIGLFGLVASSVGTLAPLLTSTIFGNKAYSEIYGAIGLGLAVGSTVALPAYGYVYDLTGSYSSVMYVLLAMLVINVVLIGLAFKEKEKMVEEGIYN